MVTANKEATEPKVPSGLVEVITFKVLWSQSWRGWPLQNTCVLDEYMFCLS
jgi:hypothetical protein